MSFPTSPTNGQTAVINNITYQYSTSSNAWTRLAGQVTSTNTLQVYGTNATTSTTTGALQVVGGVGIGGGAVVGGTVSATNFILNGYQVSTSSALTVQYAGNALGTASTLNFATGTTATIAGGVVTIQATAPTSANNLNVTSGVQTYSTNSGALTVQGGIGVSGGIFAGGIITATTFVGNLTGTATNATNVVGGTAGQLVYQTAPGVTGFLSTGSLLAGAAITATNVAGGLTGQLVYQTAPGVTGFLSTGSLLAGNAVTATNVAGGTAGQIVYQTAPGVTGFLNTATLTVGAAVTATNIAGGLAGQIPIQTAPGVTTFVNSSSLSASSAQTAVTATNISSGTAGQLVYQVSPGKTGFVGPGTLGQILVSQGTCAPAYTNTSSINVGFANQSTNILGGAAGSLPYQTAAGATSMLSLSGTSGSLLVAGASAPQYATNVQATSGTGSQTTSSGQSLVVTSGGLGVVGASYFSSNVGVGGDIYVTGNLYVDGTQTVINKTSIASGDQTIVLSTGSTSAALAQGAGLIIGQSTSSQYISLTYDGSANWVSSGGVKISSTAGTVSSTTGALQVVGGVGIQGGLVVGGTLTATNFVGNFSGNMNGTASYANTASFAGTATNLAGGALGSIPYQTAAGLTAFIGAGTQGSLLQMAASTASFVTTSSILVGAAVTATNATNILGGAANQVPYQTAAGVTAFSSNLTFNGTALTASAVTATTVAVTGTTPTSSTATGALTVAGGVGVAGGIVAGGVVSATNFILNGYQVSTSSALTVQYNGNSLGTASTLNFSTGTTATIAGNVVTIQATAPTGTSNFNVTSGVQTYSTNSGALTVQGGIGVSGGVFVGGTVTTTNLTVSGTLIAPNFSTGAGQSGSLTCAALLSTRDLQVSDVTTSGQVIITGTNVVSSTQTGALQVAGGVGIAGSVYVGGVVTATTFVGNLTGTATNAVNANTATNVAGGLAGQLVYQTAPGVTGFLSTASLTVGFATTATNVAGGTAGQLVYQSAPGVTGFLNTSTLVVGAANAATTATNIAGGLAGQIPIQTAPGVTTFINSSSIAASSAQTAVTATNISSGTAGQIVYQVSPGKTGFVGPGTAGQVLTSGGTCSPTYVSTGSLYVGTAANIGAGVANQIPYQTGPGATAFIPVTGTSGYILTSGGSSCAPSYKNTLVLSGTTQATNTASGAFQVAGGAGIGGNLFVGGSAYLSGDLYVDGTQFVVNRQTIASGDSTLLLSTGSVTAIAASGAGLAIGQSTSSPYISWTFDGANSWQSSGGVKVLSTASTNNATSGALQVAGGAGIAGNLFVGGTVTATNFVGNMSGTAAYATTATNIAGGLAGQLVYQTAPGITGFLSTGSLIVGFAATATNATNIIGGSAGNLTYQTAAGTTGFVTNGTAGQHLVFNGTAPVWVSTATFSGGTASSSTVANQSLTVTSGGVGVTGDSYFANSLVIGGVVTGGGIRTTTTSTAPTSPTVGDIWYNSSTDDIYRYTQDGSSTFWLDITGPAVANASPAYVSIATLKSIVAASTSFTDFQSRIASM